MSIKCLNWAFEQKLKPGEKIVLLALSDHARDDGYCWPSRRTICVKTSMSKSTVKRYMRKLIEQKLLTIEQRVRDNKSKTSNGYYLNMGRVQIEPWEGSTVTPLEPLLKLKKKEPKQSIPNDFKMDDKTRAWFAEHHPNINIHNFTKTFILNSQAHDYQYARPQGAIRAWADRRHEDGKKQKTGNKKPTISDIRTAFADAKKLTEGID